MPESSFIKATRSETHAIQEIYSSRFLGVVQKGFKNLSLFVEELERITQVGESLTLPTGRVAVSPDKLREALGADRFDEMAKTATLGRAMIEELGYIRISEVKNVVVGNGGRVTEAGAGSGTLIQPYSTQSPGLPPLDGAQFSKMPPTVHPDA